MNFNNWKLTYYGHYFMFIECFCLRDGTLHPLEIANWYKCKAKPFPTLFLMDYFSNKTTLCEIPVPVPTLNQNQ